jgi:hypothetical protein
MSSLPTRWVGIDEAGYGPNLGPLVMTAVVAETLDERPPDLWNDLSAMVCRAGGDPERLWVDDSKVLYRSGQGRDRLEAAALALIRAIGREAPRTVSALLGALDAGTLDGVGLSPWLDGDDPAWPTPATRERCEGNGSERCFEGASWRLEGVRAVVLGPAAFNEGLERTGSKARVHFEAFAQLLGHHWERAGDGCATHVRGDKHGGRHFYYEPLVEVFADAWIDRGVEGPELSQYTMRAPGRRLELSVCPRADASDGLVALASIVSKTIREAWMDVFNDYWTARLPGLRRSAGYPLDAARFREAVEPLCRTLGLQLGSWWRTR